MLIPDHETAVDFLNYEAIARTVTELLRDNRQRALTIGIHGDWGAGKSSVLKMIELEMSKDQRVACLWFNGWTFQGFDDAKTVLIEATIEELCRQRSTVGKVKESGKRLLKRVEWLKLARRGTGLGVALAASMFAPDQIGTIISGIQAVGANAGTMTPEEIEARLTEATSFLKPGEDVSVPEEIHKFREEFRTLLEEAKIEQLVVLIDDLDRCLPATSIETLEAIRLFLFVPKTAFVIGADEGMIEYAVRQHFPNLPITSGPMSYSRNYLEKLVQVPLRIPALGIQETRTYVTLLLIEGLVGEDHEGFAGLLAKARKSLNQPWLGSGLSQSDIRAVDPARQADLDATYFLAQQIGPILGEGTKGNPRQIKRFLNALLVRRAIAKARGFGDSINQVVLAKLMLAERFQPDFYEHLAAQAMMADGGEVAELGELEVGAREPATGSQVGRRKDKDADRAETRTDPAVAKWLEREWLQRWLRIEPVLAGIDLRPYVFVARDKRMLAAAAELGGLEGLIEKLGGSEMVVRSVEREVKALLSGDADQVFAAMKERVVRQGSFTSQPQGFHGLSIIAKHHPRFQSELLSLVGSIEPKMLGMWAIAGWNEIITDPAAKDQLRMLLNQWATQDENAVLKRGAGNALSALGRGGG